MKWPDYFPEGCPPPDAVPVNGTFLRATNERRPHKRDFKTPYERRPEDHPDDPILASGLSVYTEVEDIMRMKRRVNGMDRKHVARGTLQAVHGVMMHTPLIEENELSHYDWWRVNDCVPSSIFEPFLDPNGKNL
jgi:hypothetical protein